MRNYLTSCTVKDGSFRGVAAVTTGLIEKARKQQDALPTAIAALGRMITGVALLASLLKKGQRVSVQILSSGPVKEIYSEADYRGNLRGYIKNPRVHLPLRSGKLDVAGAVGSQGSLNVVKDLGIKQPYVGKVELISGEIAEDIAYYLTVSEQISSALGLGVFVKKSSAVGAAGGFLIQALPGAIESTISAVENNLKKIPSVTDMLRQEMGAEEILRNVFKGYEIIEYERRPLRLFCGCGRSKGKEVLRLIGPDELRKIIGDDEPVELRCHFCGRFYDFDTQEVKEILKELLKEQMRD